MTGIELVEDHYRENYGRLVKRMKFRASTEWDAEDIVQSAYERAIKYIRTFNAEREGDIKKAFNFWFLPLLNNTMRDFKNTEKGFSHSDIDEELIEQESTDCPAVPTQIRKEISELIKTKSEVQIEVLTYWFEHELKDKEISEITTIPYRTIQSIIRRFKEELKILYAN